MYKVTISPSAQKFLKTVTKPLYKKAVAQAIRDLREDPFIGEPLGRELTNYFSYRISVYRIIYKINRRDKKVSIIAADHRANVYTKK